MFGLRVLIIVFQSRIQGAVEVEGGLPVFKGGVVAVSTDNGGDYDPEKPLNMHYFYKLFEESRRELTLWPFSLATACRPWRQTILETNQATATWVRLPGPVAFGPGCLGPMRAGRMRFGREFWFGARLPPPCPRGRYQLCTLVVSTYAPYQSARHKLSRAGGGFGVPMVSRARQGDNPGTEQRGPRSGSPCAKGPSYT